MAYPLVRWTFTDTATSDTYTFEVNPNTGGSPTYPKQFNYQATAAPDGKTLIFEGRDQPQKIEFSGTLTEQSQYDAFATWWKKRSQIELVDDLGRTFTIIIENFTPTRKRNAIKPWMHDYKVSATLTVPV